MNIKFDLIIANPPYGKPGANITKNIIDNVYFEEYVNLLPANDYKRNDSKDLFKYAREMESINNGFKDAAVTTHLCKIAKKPNNITLDEFEISNYTDRSLDKYFIETRNRNHYAIDNCPTWIYFNGNLTNDNVCLLSHRVLANKHLAYSKTTAEYKWNVEKSIDLEWLANNSKCPSTPGKLNKFTIIFNTSTEKDNFCKFIYTDAGFKFVAKLAIGANCDSTTPLGKVLPKVDWTHEWTVEEILKDYGYTELEIEEIMEDLKNFRGMDD